MKNYLAVDQKNSLLDSHVFAAMQILAAVSVLALSSEVRIPLFFTPIPMTLQTLAIFFIGSLLGSKKGVISIVTYLIGGSLSSAGFTDSFILGSSGGYLVGFVAQAYIAGQVMERKELSFLAMTLCFIGASLLTLTLGTLWLGLFVGTSSMLALGFYPFVVGDLLKSLVAAAIVKCSVSKTRIKS